MVKHRSSRAAIKQPSKADKRGASSQSISLGSRFKMLLHLHKLEIKSSLSSLLKTPIASLMTLAVLGIALALPAGLQVILKNTNILSANWDSASQFSLYLKESVSDQRAESLTLRLRARSDVAEVTLIGKEQALKDFQENSGLGNAINQLDENPLPVVLEVLPTEYYSTPESTERMLKEFNALPEVEFAQLDMQWVKRLYYLLELADRAVWALALLLGSAVLLIVGNTIRLAIQNRRDEIEIIKLIGATNAFIRRPFLYTGIWYGLGGGLFAVTLISLGLWWLADPITQLSGLYKSGYQLVGLTPLEVVKLLFFSSTLGYIGSWVSVSRHLSHINPS